MPGLTSPRSTELPHSPGPVGAAYLDEVETLARTAAELNGLNPGNDLETWLPKFQFVSGANTKGTLHDAIGHNTAMFVTSLRHCAHADGWLLMETG